MQSIEAVGVEVVPDAVAAPALSAARVGSIAFSGRPAHPQVRRLGRQEVIHVINHQLKIPLPVLGGAFTHTQEDVGPHAERATQRDALRECEGTGSARQEVMRMLSYLLT